MTLSEDQTFLIYSVHENKRFSSPMLQALHDAPHAPPPPLIYSYSHGNPIQVRRFNITMGIGVKDDIGSIHWILMNSEYLLTYSIQYSFN